MKYISAIIMVFLTVFYLSCRSQNQLEVEENDSFSSANAIRSSLPVSGYINSASDRDFYSLSVDYESIMKVSLTGIKGVNHAVKLWKDNGTPLLLKLIDDRRKSSPESMVNLHVEPGRYFLEIFHGERDIRKGNTETPYILTVFLRDIDTGLEETEPNDKPERADPILNEGEITGYFSPSFNRLNVNSPHPAREEDWFVVQLDLAGEEALLLDAELTGVQGINSMLQIYDRELGLIFSSDTTGPGMGESIKGVGIRRSGNYYILVASDGYTSNDTDMYRLRVNIRANDPRMEMEPNNKFDSASAMSDFSISGSLSNGDDIDTFSRVLPDEKLAYRVELIHNSSFDGKLLIHNSSGEKIAEIDNCQICEKELHPDLPLAGSIYVTVSARKPIPADSGYELVLTPLDPALPLEIEPNNSKNRATAVKTSTVYGYISSVADKDYFLLDYDRRVRQKITITGIMSAELRLSITDPLGYIIKSVSVKNRAEVVLTEMIDRKGYIIIESIKDNFENPYTFTLEEN